MSRLSTNSQIREQGFTLVEMMVAIFILTVGVLAMGLLAARVLGAGKQSKYMSLALTLASEKLDDLNRWNVGAPQICVPSAAPSEGSLTTAVLQTTTCDSGATATVNYYDDVSITLANGSDCPNANAGCVAETVTSLDANGNLIYTTTYHSPDGVVSTPAASATAPATLTFRRYWLIEANTPVAGTRRITVLVTSLNGMVSPPVSFQMSMVRR